MVKEEDNAIEDSRALLTETDRECLQSTESSNRRYQSISRVRQRIHGELQADLLILQQHHEPLYDEFLQVIDDVR